MTFVIITIFEQRYHIDFAITDSGVTSGDTSRATSGDTSGATSGATTTSGDTIQVTSGATIQDASGIIPTFFSQVCLVVNYPFIT